MKYAFIARESASYPILALCKALQVSRSGFYEWKHRAPSKHAQKDAALLQHLRRIHRVSRERYGLIKAWKALQQEGIAVGRNRIARLRAEHRIYAKRRRRFVLTTKSKYSHEIPPNLLNRQFTVSAANKVWAGDVTFIATQGGWLYLAVLIDLYSRKVVGWSMSRRNNSTLVNDCLIMALQRRKPEAGLIHHSDRGRTYDTKELRALFKSYGLIASMSRKGNCWDNAVVESFFGQLKNELVCDRIFQTVDVAKTALFEYIEVFYNRQRLHQTLGYATPEQYEMRNVA